LAFLWTLIGVTGGIIFFGRFYVQWYVSERQKKSVVPILFWYMSSAGVVLLLPYAVFWLQSPVGALSYSFNLVVYARNLNHIWRDQGVLTARRKTLLNGAVVMATVVAVALVIVTWLGEYHATKDAAPPDMVKNWFWIGIGTLGQILFGCRFLIQWIATEAKRKSVIPVVFWHISVVASVLQAASYIQRAEWVFALGLIATLPVYLRNLWLIYRHKTPAAPPGE